MVYFRRSDPQRAVFERPDPSYVQVFVMLPAIWIIGLIWLLGVGGTVFGNHWRV
jgi:hypothetical protein